MGACRPAILDRPKSANPRTRRLLSSFVLEIAACTPALFVRNTSVFLLLLNAERSFSMTNLPYSKGEGISIPVLCDNAELLPGVREISHGLRPGVLRRWAPPGFPLSPRKARYPIGQEQ